MFDIEGTVRDALAFKVKKVLKDSEEDTVGNQWRLDQRRCGPFRFPWAAFEKGESVRIEKSTVPRGQAPRTVAAATLPLDADAPVV